MLVFFAFALFFLAWSARTVISSLVLDNSRYVEDNLVITMLDIYKIVAIIITVQGYIKLERDLTKTRFACKPNLD